MSRKGEETRNRIMDAAHALILEQGYASTPIDQVIEKTGIAKGAFFYHFKSKTELAEALVERYARTEESAMTETMRRAENLSRDPLQQVLLLVGLFEEMFAGLTEPHPGCLFASYCYQNELMTERVHTIVAATVLLWRDVLKKKFLEIEAIYPPREKTNYDSLADMFLTVFEGAFVLSKTLNDPGVIVAQLRNYKTYIELLFSSDR